ncbi:MAG: DNA-directed polymerase [Bacillales bacterium]|jgi:DNA polymerase-4|nr:DNA-directed polymerase [Bacillales bacterium]
MQNFYPKSGRVILHVDMNSYYASVEVANDPTLQGKPLVIAGNEKERRGIIVTCSYEARAFGIRATMPLWEAKKRCPHLVIRKPNHELYRKTAYQIFEIMAEFSPILQPVSIDEAYIDISNCSHLGTPIEISEKIQTALLERLKLPCSIGIAPNRFLAKTASDMKKPLGITVLRKREVPTILWPRKVEEMHGIGIKTAEKLNEISIFTIEDLAKANEYLLKEKIGNYALVLKERANGIDEREVDPNAILEFKSIGNSTTLPNDVSEESHLIETLKLLSDKVAMRLKRKNAVAVTLQIMIKYANRKMVTRSKKLFNPIQDPHELLHEAVDLFMKNWSGDPVRLLGVTAQEVINKSDAFKQLNIFNYEQDIKDEPIVDVIEKINAKFGTNIISKGIRSEVKDEKQMLYDFLKRKMEINEN